MKLKIFSYLNVSNPSNLEADSGYIFQKILFGALIKIYPDLEIIFVCPSNTPFIDSRVRHIFIDDGYLNKYSVRFNFAWNFFMRNASLLADVDYAIINQSELTSNFRAYFSVINNTKVKIITYFHYLPIDGLPINGRVQFTENMNHAYLAKTIFSRQMEALSQADYCITCSKYAIQFIKLNAEILNKEFGEAIESKFINIAPPISMEEVDSSYCAKRFRKKTFIYNHRLYSHYGTEIIFNWLSEIYDEKQNFSVLVTDPTGKRSKERDVLDTSVKRLYQWIKEKPFVRIERIKSHQEYYKTLWSCHAGLGLLKPSALWSMSSVDVLACAKPLIAPNYACFPEMLNNRTSLLFNNKAEFKKIFGLILDNEDYYTKESMYCRNLANKYASNEIASSFSKLFQNDKLEMK